MTADGIHRIPLAANMEMETARYILAALVEADLIAVRPEDKAAATLALAELDDSNVVRFLIESDLVDEIYVSDRELEGVIAQVLAGHRGARND